MTLPTRPRAPAAVTGIAWAVLLSLVAWPLLWSVVICVVGLTMPPAALLGIALAAGLVATVAHGMRGR